MGETGAAPALVRLSGWPVARCARGGQLSLSSRFTGFGGSFHGAEDIALLPLTVADGGGAQADLTAAWSRRSRGPVTVRLERPEWLTGRVIDAASRQPIAHLSGNGG